MRLLEFDNDGKLSLTTFFADKIPQKYAILSHTWEAEEVTFEDLQDGTATRKAGYKKIRFCGEQAKRDGLQYFWVDTCCIDKSNSTELAEAINSMFLWYRRAAKCYVYLSDVSINKRKAKSRCVEFTWEPTFRDSRWFTRGWTLQELLAPNVVEFFSRECKRLGDKKSLERQVHEITAVPISALQGAPLCQFSINERLLWAEHRQTTQQEDKAYSLLGIFEVYMPLIYGEGTDNAFKRLREKAEYPLKGLDLLPSAANAPFNSYSKQDEPICLPDTRVDLLQEIYNWADGQDDRCIYWLNGWAGTGKSTIARTIARRYFDQKKLAASFFFSRGSGDVGHAGRFFTSLAIQLARNVPHIQRLISDAVIEQNNIADQSLRDQWRQLICRPFSKLDKRLSPFSYLLIVDALDECNNENHMQTILRLLAEARSFTTVRLRVFLTSRPEVPIRHGMCRIPQAECQDFILHNISPVLVDHDIAVFLKATLEEIRDELRLEAGWPGDEVIKKLVRGASSLFIWAATACRFIREGKRFAVARLSLILKENEVDETAADSSIDDDSTYSSPIEKVAIAPEEKLNRLYTAVLENSSCNYTKQEKRIWYKRLKEALGSLVLLFSPLSVLSLARLLDMQCERIIQVLDDFHSILDIPKDPACPLRLHHPSFRDFLLSKSRCGKRYYVDETQVHQVLAGDCIRLMSNFLKQDICRQKTPGATVASVESGCIQKCLPPEVQYACLYWVQHLQKSNSQLSDNSQVYQFLQVHLLHWLEALGWMGKTSEGILAILSLESHIIADRSPNLHAFIHDAKRFTLHNRSIIEQTPLQLYCSALVFAPGNSTVRRQFKDCIPSWIQTKPKVQADWNTLQQTLEGHSGAVNCVAFSPDGQRVVSGSNDETVRLWDAATGALQQTLEGHSSWVNSVAFSPDGQRVVSGSNDETVRLWDAATGALQQTLEGRSSWVKLVAFSPDGQRVVSGSKDNTVLLWDAATGALQQTLEDHSSWVELVAFSPDGQRVVSGSVDETVRLWDAATGALQQTLEGHSGAVNCVAFSPDGQRVVSGSYDDTIRLWDAAASTLRQTLEGHSSWVNSVAFSPDGQRVVSGSNDETVRLWDAATGALQQTLEGHLSAVNSVAFSPDGQRVVSGSEDRAVWLWDAATGALQQRLKGYSGAVTCVAFSPDGQRVVSGSDDKTIQLWDAAASALQQTLEGHSGAVTSVAFSPDGQRVVSGSDDETIRLWDAATGALQQTLERHSDMALSIDISDSGAHSLVVSHEWIAEREANILWLPPDYRAISAAVWGWGNCVVLGHYSGNVSILKFKPVPKVI